MTLWIALTATTTESTLEYVKGSHRGPIYDSKYGQHRSLPCVPAPPTPIYLSAKVKNAPGCQDPGH